MIQIYTNQFTRANVLLKTRAVIGLINFLRYLCNLLITRMVVFS